MSSSDYAIRTEGLGKRYNLGETVSGRRILKQLGYAVHNSVSGLSGGLIRPATGAVEIEHLWAVRDVSFELGQGEVLGLIGPNGAGKSTLLKLLCRITAPTAGRILLQGRVGALLEVGAGFKSMLSGRENLYLQGAWLGMSKREIDDNIDEIIDFSGLQGFLDTPVKRYSSGMRLRLAFSVAAHLNPEIVIIDEALAVGDAGFRQKCIRKLTQIAQSGRTVIFVSHIPELITSLCTRALWLDRGRMVMDGEPAAVMRAYAQSGRRNSTGSSDLQRRHDRRGNGKMRITHINTLDSSGKALAPAVVGNALVLAMDYESLGEDVHDLTMKLTLRNGDGMPVLFLTNSQTGTQLEKLPARGRVRCRIERLALLPGSYSLDVDAVLPSGRADYIRNAHQVDIAAGPFFANTTPLETRGVFFTDQDWTLEDV